LFLFSVDLVPSSFAFVDPSGDELAKRRVQLRREQEESMPWLEQGPGAGNRMPLASSAASLFSSFNYLWAVCVVVVATMYE
jgi:hypothetical protein